MLCHEEEIAVMADEVYQANVYDDSVPFVSARSALAGMGGAVAAETEVRAFPPSP